MGFKDLHLKLIKGLTLTDSAKTEFGFRKKLSVSHGYQVLEDRSLWEKSEESFRDLAVVRREETNEVELCFYGIFDKRIGDGVTEYVNSHLLGMGIEKIKRKNRESMSKTQMGSAKLTGHTDGNSKVFGFASATVINGKKLVIANMGDYRAVVCINGMAHHINKRQQLTAKTHWSRRLISGTFRLPNMCMSGNKAKILDFAITNLRIYNDVEFVILASIGIWEVMMNQEAMNLISHISHPQEAAECLAREALNRNSRGNISCMVVRFH